MYELGSHLLSFVLKLLPGLNNVFGTTTHKKKKRKKKKKESKICIIIIIKGFFFLELKIYFI